MNKTRGYFLMRLGQNKKEDSDLRIETNLKMSFPPSSSKIKILSNVVIKKGSQSSCSEEITAPTLHENQSMLDDKTGELIQIPQEDFSTDFSFQLPENYYLDEKTGKFIEIEENSMTSIESSKENNENDLDSLSESFDESNAPGISSAFLDETSGLTKRKRSRKGLGNSSNWEVNKAKRAREQGKPYLSQKRIKGTKVGYEERRKRSMGPACKSGVCQKSMKRRCNEIKDEDRLLCFKSFWSEMTWEQRKCYVNALVEISDTKCKTTKGESRRHNTVKYSLMINNEHWPVCKKMFLSTLCLGEKTVLGWIEKANKHGIISRTNRKNNKEKCNREKLIHVKTFLSALPKMPSHYCRANTEKVYLDINYKSGKDVYKQYKQYLKDESIHDKKVTYQCFLKKMHCMNIALYSPKKDQCDTCFAFKNKNISEEEYETHIDEKNRAREEKKRDKERALKNEINLFTVDVQAVQVIPFLKASATYFRQKLHVHQFTICNLGNGNVVCYVWHEGEGSMDADIFSSCILHFIDQELTQEEKEKPIVIYSDGCCAQNRNSTLSNALYYYCIKNNVNINQKYLVKGHTQMECDSVHAIIEKKKKNREMYVPADFVQIIQQARINNPYKVHYVSYDFFKKYCYIKYFNSIRPGSKKGDPCVNNIRALKYSKNGIQYKIKFDDDWADLPQRKKNIPLPSVANLYSQSLAIPSRKFNDLQALKYVIPKDYHSFFDNLLHD